MSDYEDLCEMYGTDAGDPDFIDWFIGLISDQEPRIEKNEISDGLPKGRIVHMVKLNNAKPAKPIDAKFHFKLPNDASFIKANVLRYANLDEPAGWFVKHGFIVRSMKENNFWYQLAYKNTDAETILSNELVEEYYSFSNLPFKRLAWTGKMAWTGTTQEN